MGKKRSWLLAALIIFWVAVPVSAEPVFRIVYSTQASPPRIMGDGSAVDWSKPGITLELLKMVEKKVGLPFQFQRIPWKRCLYMVEHGLADATFHASFKPKRAEYGVYPTRDSELDPTRRIYKNSYVIYVLKGSEVHWDGKTLQNVSGSIGTQLSYAIADDLRKQGYQVEEEGGVTGNLNKLLAGRISAYADLETIVDNVLRKEEQRYSSIKKVGPPLSEKVYYLFIGKSFAAKYPQLTERIWDAVRDVQQADAYIKMLKRYLD